MDVDALLAATHRGDLCAFEALVRSQAGRLRRIALQIARDESLADDVTQEAFLRALRVPAAARPSRAAAAWLSRVTVRVALNVLGSERARRRREERYAKERSAEMKDRVPTGIALPHDLDRPVGDALASLSPETRAAIWLHVVEGEGVREVAACLGSSRSAVSRRIRAGLETMLLSLARSGAAFAGTAAIGGALRGSEIPPAESLVLRILKAGKLALASGAASTIVPDALDAALAAPVRSLRSFAGIGSAAVFTIGLLAGLGWFFLLPPGRGPKKEGVLPVASAPAVPSKEGRHPQSEIRPIKTAPPAPVKTPAEVAGTVRDENDQPISSAEVYLAMHPPARDDRGQDAFLGQFFRADYYTLAHFLATKTDAQGRFAFKGVPGSGSATLGAFKEGYSGALAGVKVDEGARSEAQLVLDEGVTLTGKVSTADGSPVTDAVVSVCQAWSPTDHVFKGAGLGPTDENGRFQLGLGAKTTACHLRVNSDSQGQHFFIEVPVRDEEIELTFQESAQVEGRITWTDGAPATGLTVRATGRLTEPPIPIERMGMRPTTVHDGLVGDDGTYAIHGLHPRLAYDIFVIDGSLGEREASMRPLSQRMANSFRLEAGEVKVWDHAVPKPITLRGRIRTEKGTPLSQGHVGARKDGKPLNFAFAEANEEGVYELHVNDGPGEYLVHARPPAEAPESEPADDLIAERFGKKLHLAGGEEAEVDLTIFEPAVLTVRVLDYAGQPVKSIRAVLHVTFPDGRKSGHDAPRVLDDAGRTAFLIYDPAPEFWYEIGSFSGGPVVETPRYASRPGIAIGEKTVVLPRTCQLQAELVDPSGNAWGERTVSLHVDYEDGTKADFACRTDKQGKFSDGGKVRAAPFVLEIRSLARKALWNSQRLDGSSVETLDLGRIVLGADND
jgi:RNA polymerase sigma-70 factor (ECF subfamily)